MRLKVEIALSGQCLKYWFQPSCRVENISDLVKELSSSSSPQLISHFHLKGQLGSDVNLTLDGYALHYNDPVNILRDGDCVVLGEALKGSLIPTEQCAADADLPRVINKSAVQVASREGAGAAKAPVHGLPAVPHKGAPSSSSDDSDVSSSSTSSSSAAEDRQPVLPVTQPGHPQTALVGHDKKKPSRSARRKAVKRRLRRQGVLPYDGGRKKRAKLLAAAGDTTKEQNGALVANQGALPSQRRSPGVPPRPPPPPVDRDPGPSNLASGSAGQSKSIREKTQKKGVRIISGGQTKVQGQQRPSSNGSSEDLTSSSSDDSSSSPPSSSSDNSSSSSSVESSSSSSSSSDDSSSEEKEESGDARPDGSQLRGKGLNKPGPERNDEMRDGKVDRPPKSRSGYDMTRQNKVAPAVQPRTNRQDAPLPGMGGGADRQKTRVSSPPTSSAPHPSRTGLSEEQFSLLAPLARAVVVGDVVAYKLLEVGSDWTPKVSSPRQGRVTEVDAATTLMTLEPYPDRNLHPLLGPHVVKERANVEGEDEDEGPRLLPPDTPYQEDGVLTTEAGAFVEMRLVQAAKTPPAAPPLQDPGMLRGSGSTDTTPVAPMRGGETAAAPEGIQAGGASTGGSVIPAVGVWKEIAEQLRRRREELQAQEDRVRLIPWLPPPPSNKRQTEKGGSRCTPTNSDSTAQVDERVRGHDASEAQPEGLGRGRVAGVEAPGPVKPRGGVRRTAVGPLLQYLRHDN